MHLNPERLMEIAVRRRYWIGIPVLATTFVALVYAICMTRYWAASQALYIRDEGNASQRLGRFESVDAMQTAQETILEVARHQSVLKAAMQDVGPLKKLSKKRRQKWPSADDIDTFKSQVYVQAPNGAKFGRTEMIYVTVKAENADRSVLLTDAVTKRLVGRMQTLRREKYAGIVAELEKAVESACQERDAAAERLHALEQSVGVDLAELRVLMNEGQGDGNLRRSSSEITSEIRQVEARKLAMQKEYEMLKDAKQDPRRLIAMPSEVLDKQPLLKRLKEGLVDAQLHVSKTLGELNPDHPRSKAAILAEQKIRQQLYLELKAACSLVKHQVDIIDAQKAALQGRAGNTKSRLEGLADLRTTYGMAVAEVKQRTSLLEAATAELANARANLLAATASSLIQPVDKPIPSSKPVGLGRKTVVMIGFLLGISIGFGLVFLIEPVEGGQDRRWNDHVAISRRSSDASHFGRFPPVMGADRRALQNGGRRTTDVVATVAHHDITGRLDHTVDDTQ